MLNFVKHAVVAATVLACAAASAGIVTFEGPDFKPDIYSGGDMFGSGFDKLTVLGQGGFSGAIVQGSDASTCTIVACPVGNASRYFTGLNDGGLSFRRTDMSILLRSLDFGFVLPVDGLVGDVAVGQLQITGTDSMGATTQIAKNFSGQNANSKFAFSRWDIDGTFAQTRFTQVAFTACLYLTDGTCSFNSDFTQNQAQFAIDNIAFVPEPASLALVALSLGGMFAVRRRKSAAAV